jgi:hypothetical protein
MMTSLLQDLQRSGGGAVSAPAQRVIDDADAVVELATPAHTAVVFPTADTLGEARGSAHAHSRAPADTLVLCFHSLSCASLRPPTRPTCCW